MFWGTAESFQDYQFYRDDSTCEAVRTNFSSILAWNLSLFAETVCGVATEQTSCALSLLSVRCLAAIDVALPQCRKVCQPEFKSGETKFPAMQCLFSVIRLFWCSVQCTSYCFRGSCESPKARLSCPFELYWSPFQWKKSFPPEVY